LLRGFASAEDEEDFNRFDAGLCDVSSARFRFDVFADRLAFAALGFVLDFALDFAADFALGLEPFEDSARTDGLDEGLGDFLRDFLDIRLPFVAFGGSTIRVLRGFVCEPESSRWLGKSDGLGVWLQGIRRTGCPLVQ
jgi:hypothetical protein